MNNSESLAPKHYLQITDVHHLADCGITPESKAVSPAVTAASFMPIHAPSAKTQTLQNKAFPVTDHHDPSQEMPKWAMRDSTVHAFKAVNRGLLGVSETEAVSPAVTNPTLSETVALLIDGWDNMCPEERAVLTALLWANSSNV
jgi:hypothetical protein